ncbi:MAG: hypothetical protein J4F45_09470 [Pseudomonadales bacterium]|nr:hypothetical protein [Pseudomonadales bacterium]
MPIGPNGEKRPASVVSNAVRCMMVATGEAEEKIIRSTALRRARERSYPLPHQVVMLAPTQRRRKDT